MYKRNYINAYLLLKICKWSVINFNLRGIRMINKKLLNIMLLVVSLLGGYSAQAMQPRNPEGNSAQQTSKTLQQAFLDARDLELLNNAPTRNLLPPMDLVAKNSTMGNRTHDDDGAPVLERSATMAHINHGEGILRRQRTFAHNINGGIQPSTAAAASRASVVTVDDIRAALSNPYLEELIIGGNITGGEGQALITGIMITHPNIKKITLTCPHIKKITLTCPLLQQVDLKTPALRHLDVSGCENLVSFGNINRQPAHGANNSSLPKLANFNANGCVCLPAQEILKMVSGGLEELSLKGCLLLRKKQGIVKDLVREGFSPKMRLDKEFNADVLTLHMSIAKKITCD